MALTAFVAAACADVSAQEVVPVDLETFVEPVAEEEPEQALPPGRAGGFGGGFVPGGGSPFVPAAPGATDGRATGVGELLGEGASKELWKRYEEDSRQYKRELAARLLERQKKLVKDLEAERDKLVEQRQFEQAADLQIAIRRLRQSVMPVHPDPGYLTNFRGQEGKVLFFRVVGTTEGTVWGTDLYTDDSRLSTAAVHAGVLADGQTGVVKVTLLKPDGPFRGSSRNGVTTNDYGDWPNAYSIERP